MLGNYTNQWHSRMLLLATLSAVVCFSCVAEKPAKTANEEPDQVILEVISEKDELVVPAVTKSLQSEVVEKMSEVKDLMGTYVGIDVCVAPSKKDQYAQAMAQIWDRLGNIHWNLSVYADKGDVFNINHSYKNPAYVDEETIKLLERSIEYSQLTGGAFDITVAPLGEFWKEMVKKKSFPLSQEIQYMREAIGVDKIKINPSKHQVELIHPRSKIDLGGIAKGYAIDEAVRILRQYGFNDFLVDAGGDVFVGEKNCANKPWQIGVRDPRSATSLYDVAQVSNIAVATSGDYEQFEMLKGKMLSHIINPLTGYPQKTVTSSTVIAPDATKADALATALAVMGPEKGIELINGLGEGYAAIILYHDSKTNAIKEMASQFYPQYTTKKK